MIWETNTSVVIMLTNIIEKGVVKCAQYWPSELSESITYGVYRVTLTDIEVSSEVTTRRMDLMDVETNNMRTIVHFHYTNWPGKKQREREREREIVSSNI
jgi:protein tyrosine phosphatase